MSNWTHVAAIFRVDSLRFGDNTIDFKEIFGQELRFNDGRDKFEEAQEHPDRFLPCGSEGSLEMSVWTNPERNCIAAYTVSIFGDLRDHESIDDVITWFDEKCESLAVRQAVITVDNEYLGTKTKTYGELWKVRG